MELCRDIFVRRYENKEETSEIDPDTGDEIFITEKCRQRCSTFYRRSRPRWQPDHRNKIGAMKIIKFYEQGFTPVYSDMIVLMGNQIHGISIIGSEIVVKAYRAKFMDNVMAKANLRFWYEDKIVRLAYKPAQKYTVFPQVVTEQGLQVVMMNDQLIWGISQEDLLVKVYQLLYDLNIPAPYLQKTISKTVCKNI